MRLVGIEPTQAALNATQQLFVQGRLHTLHTLIDEDGTWYLRPREPVQEFHIECYEHSCRPSFAGRANAFAEVCCDYDGQPLPVQAQDGSLLGAHVHAVFYTTPMVITVRCQSASADLEINLHNIIEDWEGARGRIKTHLLYRGPIERLSPQLNHLEGAIAAAATRALFWQPLNAPGYAKIF